MDKKKLVICGDSFNVGIGLVDMIKQRYGQLVANKFDWELIMLARGSASNYSIYLQAQHAAKLQPHCVIMNFTSNDRIEWIIDKQDKDTFTQLAANNINYHLYPPHYHPQPYHEPLDFYFKNNPEYNPLLLTEQVGAIDEYLKIKPLGSWDYYRRMQDESPRKLKIILDFYLEVWYNNSIKIDYDVGVFLMAYTMLKRQNIKCLILSSPPGQAQFDALIDKKDVIPHDWGMLSRKYPDTIGSSHADYPAHEYTAKLIIDRIIKNGYQ